MGENDSVELSESVKKYISENVEPKSSGILEIHDELSDFKNEESEFPDVEINDTHWISTSEDEDKCTKKEEIINEDDPQFIQLQKENRELLDELVSKVDQVRNVERQVVEISTLQDTFSTKVEEQAEEIENLHQLAVESTTHVTHAKDLLSQASADGINFRLFVVVLLACMSVALLFVHVYN